MVLWGKTIVAEQSRSSEPRRTIDWEMAVSPHHDGKGKAYIQILAAKCSLGDDARHNTEKSAPAPAKDTSNVVKPLLI
jgi:hypothetical protein